MVLLSTDLERNASDRPFQNYAVDDDEEDEKMDEDEDDEDEDDDDEVAEECVHAQHSLTLSNTAIRAVTPTTRILPTKFAVRRPSC